MPRSPTDTTRGNAGNGRAAKRPAASAIAPAPALERKLRADAQRNRAAVLAAAHELFAERGIDAQMEDIAQAAGVGVGTVYRHFPTKEHLIEALTRARFEVIAERGREELAEPDPWRAFSGFMRFSAESQAHDRAFSEVMASDREMKHAVVADSGVIEISAELIDRAQRAGELRPDFSVEDVPTFLCGLGRVLQSADDPAGMNWERFLEVVLDGLRTPAAKRRS
jgi:AcrR family transcriptional regulator